MKIYNVFYLTVVLLLIASPVLAICEGPIVPCGGTGMPACKFCHFFVVLDNILKLVFTCFAPLVATLMFVVAGLFLIFSTGDPNMKKKAKDIITATVIGFVLIFTAWLIVDLFFTMIGVADLKGGWFKIECPIE